MNFIIQKVEGEKPMKNLSVVLLSLICTQSFAMKKSSTVDFYGAEFRGFEQLGIKRLLRDDLSRRELSVWNIENIQVEAKSFDGQSQIKLVSGRGEIASFDVQGTPDNYDSQLSGYQTNSFRIPSYANRDGALKLVMIGDIKLSEIKVDLEASPSYDFRNVSKLQFADETNFKVSKVLGSSETIRVNGPVDGIKLIGDKEKVSVTGVTLHFSDGERIELTELDGRLKPGQSVAFRFAHELDRPLDKIVVSAVSSSLFGSRGRLKVQLGNK